MRRLIVFFALIALVMSFFPLAARAGEGDVAVGGELILRIRFPSPGMTIQQRADLITERVTEFLGQGSMKPEDIQVTSQNKETVIVVKDQLLLTVDKRTADFNKATPKQLAEMWVKHIREVLPGLVPGIYQR